MTTSNGVLACFWDRDQKKLYIETVQIATQPSPPRDYSSEDEFRQSHVQWFTELCSSNPTYEHFLLPRVQPECPKHWELNAWKERAVVGNAQYHLFYHKDGKFQHNHPFILKVFGTSRDREWVYKDMDPLSLELREELQEFVEQTSKMVLMAALWGRTSGCSKDSEGLTGSVREAT